MKTLRRIAFWTFVALFVLWVRGQIKREYRLAREAEIHATDREEHEEHEKHTEKESQR